MEGTACDMACGPTGGCGASLICGGSPSTCQKEDLCPSGLIVGATCKPSCPNNGGCGEDATCTNNRCVETAQVPDQCPRVGNGQPCNNTLACQRETHKGCATGFVCSSTTGPGTCLAPTQSPTTYYVCNKETGTCDASRTPTAFTDNGACNTSCVADKYICDTNTGSCTKSNSNSGVPLAQCQTSCTRGSPTANTPTGFRYGVAGKYNYITNIFFIFDDATKDAQTKNGVLQIVNGSNDELLIKDIIERITYNNIRIREIHLVDDVGARIMDGGCDWNQHEVKPRLMARYQNLFTDKVILVYVSNAPCSFGQATRGSFWSGTGLIRLRDSIASQGDKAILLHEFGHILGIGHSFAHHRDANGVANVNNFTDNTMDIVGSASYGNRRVIGLLPFQLSSNGVSQNFIVTTPLATLNYSDISSTSYTSYTMQAYIMSHERNFIEIKTPELSFYIFVFAVIDKNGAIIQEMYLNRDRSLCLHIYMAKNVVNPTILEELYYVGGKYQTPASQVKLGNDNPENRVPVNLPALQVILDNIDVPNKSVSFRIKASR